VGEGFEEESVRYASRFVRAGIGRFWWGVGGALCWRGTWRWLVFGQVGLPPPQMLGAPALWTIGTKTATFVLGFLFFNTKFHLFGICLSRLGLNIELVLSE
jgi:hypothetical protein